MKLDVGSGNSKKEGYERMDICSFENVTIVHDMEKIPYPVDTESCSDIRMHHSLEHCSFIAIPKILKECYRIMKKDGILEIEVPCVETAMKKFLELSEEKRWDSRAFEYIYGNQGSRLQGKQIHKCGFTSARLKFLVVNAAFKILSLTEYENNIEMRCIRLKAQKDNK